MVADLPELLVGDVEVVDEPLLGECNLPLRPDRLDDAVVRVEKYAPVVAGPTKQVSSANGLVGEAIGRRQTLGVFLQALGAKQLGANRLFRMRGSCDHPLCDAHHVWHFGRQQGPVAAWVMKCCGSEETPDT